MKLDEHADRQISWDFLVMQVRTATAEEFRDAFPGGFTFRDSQGRQVTQRTQTVTARLDLGGNDTQPPPPPGQGLRFGVVAQQVGNQLRITRVFDDSPAKRVTISGTNTRAALEVGDVIVGINGRAIRTEQEFLNAVAGSGRNMSLEIICRRNSTRYNLDVYLAH
jgi:S1-C subfamily serine protease